MYAQISSGQNDPIRFGQNLIQMFHALFIFNLCQEPQLFCARGQRLPQNGHILPAVCKGEHQSPYRAAGQHSDGFQILSAQGRKHFLFSCQTKVFAALQLQA